MSDERVYRVASGSAIPLRPVTLADAGLKERSDLQEWVLARPEILGPDVMIVTFEFDRWEDTRGERQRDRLDVLGLDSDGRLVLAELKRDAAPDTVEMQAIKYAAMASRFTPEDVIRYHAIHLTQRGANPVTEAAAQDALVEHAGDLTAEQLAQPRIILVAGSFPASTTATAVWLTEMGLDITLQQVQAYAVDNDTIIITVSQLLPLPELEEFTIAPQRAEALIAREGRRKREASTVVRLVKQRRIADGAILTLRPTTEVDGAAREAVEEWVREDPARGTATWHNDAKKPLEWHHDGKRYRPTTIAQIALREAADLERSVRGPAWWVTSEGLTLTSLGESMSEIANE